MRKEAKTLWLNLLKELPQVKGRLRDIEGCYCVMGALCEAYRRETGKGEWRRSVDNPERFDFCVDGDNGGVDRLYPYAVQKWAGLEDECPVIDDLDVVSRNDGTATFKDLIPLIQSHL